MVVNRFNPGCSITNCSCTPVSDPCFFVDDTFTRADAGTPGANYEVITGSWPIVSNELVGDGKLLAVAECPTGPAMAATVMVRGADGESASILLAANDTATEYIEATVTFGASGSLSIDIVGEDGDGDTVAGEVPVDTWLEFSACYNGTSARASIDLLEVAAILPGALGDRVGLLATDDTRFDDFRVQEVSEECGVCADVDPEVGTIECVFCDADGVALYYQIEIEGLAEDTDCEDCETLDGVYIIGPMEQIMIDGDPQNCSHGILLEEICSGSAEPDCYGLLGLVFYQFGGSYFVRLTLQSGATDCGLGGGEPKIEWELDLGPAPPDCLFRDEFGVPQTITLPWLSDGISGLARCTGAGSTVTIKAIPAP